MGAFKDDDRYKELPDWDKFLFMHFWIGDKHFRIPSPFEVGVLFCSLPVTIANIVNGNEDMKFLGEWAKTSAGDVLGIDITPQLTKPLIEFTTNKNTFTGRKNSPGLYGRSAQARAVPSLYVRDSQRDREKTERFTVTG